MALNKINRILCKIPCKNLSLPLNMSSTFTVEHMFLFDYVYL